jgi:ankyrin repeat protein
METAALLLTMKDIKPDSPDTEKRTPLSFAAEAGNLQAMEQLISTGKIDINAASSTGLTPIRYAVRSKNFEAINLLLVHDAVICAGSLSDAVERNLIDATRLLLKHGANQDDQSSHIPDASTLLQAAESGYVEVSQLLLDAGANINFQRSHDGETALHRAALHGWTEVVKLLLSRGALRDIENSRGETALHIAVAWGEAEAFEVLFNDDIATQTERNFDILVSKAKQAFSQHGHEKILNFLVAFQPGGIAALDYEIDYHVA